METTEHHLLEMQHITPYLPYKLELITQIYKNGRCQGTQLMSIRSIEDVIRMVNRPAENKALFPILKPISDLTKEIGEEIGLDPISVSAILFAEKSSKLSHNSEYLVGECIYYKDIVILLKHHYDVFGLIGKDLAVDKKKVVYE